MKTRVERDFLGEKQIPAEVYYGVQTARAVDNFPISGIRPHPEFVRASAMIKRAAAQTNVEEGRLDRSIGEAIVQAAGEVMEGKLQDQFVVDVFQAGAGTSHHMNVNEVIANRAIERLGGEKGDYKLVHPNDHVNMGQSTNDVFPTAMRLAALSLLKALSPVLDHLKTAFNRKAEEFDRVLKSGRTHLQDAVPVRLGQEFGAYGASTGKAAREIERAAEPLKELGIGGSAAGTGLNTTHRYRRRVVEILRELSGFDLQEAKDLFEAMNSMAPFAGVSGALKILALELTRIANDLRLLSSGPRTGLAEIQLPPVQPGSSIMPGKVNPVMAEMLNMVCFHVVGNDLTISMAAQAGQLELNVMMPVIAFDLLQSLHILRNALVVFTERCVEGIVADPERCQYFAEHSVGVATAFNPYVGYERAAEVAKESAATGKSMRQIVLARGWLSEKELDRILDPLSMTEPQ